MIQIRSFTILLFALNVLLRDSIALVNLTSVDDFFQIWALVHRLESCTTSTISSIMTGYTPSISNQTASLRSTLEDHSLSTYCTSTRGTCTRQNADRHFHDLFTWLKLYPWHLFRIVFTCVSSSVSFQTYCHRVCLITRVLELDILFTSAIVKIILAGIDSTSDVKTLRIDLDPTSQLRTLQTNNLGVRLVGLILISVILCLISD